MQTRFSILSKIIFLTILFLTVLTTNISAATFTVTNINDSGAGSLRQAVLDANVTATADTIVFDASFNTPRTITLLTTIEISPSFALNDTLTITGPGANLLTISGNNATQLFRMIVGDTASFSGMRMTGGNGVFLGSLLSNGGAILSDGSLTLTNMIFTNNTSQGSGGAVSTSSDGTVGSGVLNVVGCTFTNNTSTAVAINGAGGGAIHGGGTVIVTITNSTFTGSSSMGGGGLRFDGGVINITGSTVSNSTSGGAGNADGGGGIFNFGDLTLTNSTVSNNTAGEDTEGGGIRSAFN